MAKQRTIYRCTECGREQPKWSGRCSGCGEWSTFVEGTSQPERPASAPPRAGGPRQAIPISQVNAGEGGEVRIRTGIGEFDRVLGDGLVSGSLTLLGGDPGVGKSTLLLMSLARLSARGITTLYVTGEESARQVRLRADRLGVGGDNLYLLADTDFATARRAVEDLKPRFMVIDSVQVLRAPGVESVPGSVSQIRAVADQAMEIAKGLDVATVLIGHVTRAGNLAGPKMLEHLVDTVLHFECDGRTPLRILRSVKNRFGPAGEAGMFEMGEEGLVEVPDASARLLSERVPDAPGTAIVATMEGSRPLLCEVQALVGRPSQGTPARTTLGVERARVAVLLAVLDKLGLPLSERDVYVNAAGGVRLSEPAVDLGVVAAIVSSAMDRPLPADWVFFGEVGLVGEVRAASYPTMRLKEACRHRFKRAIVPPAAARDAPKGIELYPITRLQHLLELIADA